MARSFRTNVQFIAQFGLLLAIEAIFCFTVLGSLPIGPIVATLAMLPVIITAILMGTVPGAIMGFFAGLFSFIVWTFMPPNPIIAFAFTPFYSLGKVSGNMWSLVICFVPRILVGVVTGLLYTWLRPLLRSSHKSDWLAYTVSGFLGSMANTILVLFGIYLFFGETYATAIGSAYQLLFGLIGLTLLTNGLPEAILGAVIAYGVCKPLKGLLEKNKL